MGMSKLMNFATVLDYANSHMQSMFGQATRVSLSLGGKKVIITETGWPSQGERLKGAEASSINAMKYFIDTQQWSYEKGIEIFYFASFDESWKRGDEGEAGAYWGLWDKLGKLKF